MNTILQGGEKVSRMAHNHEVEGASPSPATISLPHDKTGVQEGGLTAEPQPLQSTLRAFAPKNAPALVAGQRAWSTEGEDAVGHAVAELEAAAAFLKSRYLEGLIEQTLFAAVQRANSPWLDRAGAAAYCQCSTSELDRVAAAGVIKTYLRGGTPLFRRADLDETISTGRWPKRKTTNQRKHT